jgi:hypothetical protein
MQTQPGFAIYENKQITLYNIEGNKITSLDVLFFVLAMGAPAKQFSAFSPRMSG